MKLQLNGFDLIALFAIPLTAVGVLPGTLGILKMTGRIAASPAGARFIYSQSGLLIVIALTMVVFSLYESALVGAYSMYVTGSAIAVAILLVYGFLMHAKLLFKPIRNPVFISIDDALRKFGDDEEVVGVIDKSGKPFAFVARLARRPHIVYHSEGDAPFIMTHCILAHSSMSYALEGNFSKPEITITAALANNMVFYEKSSRCSVVQINNRLEGSNEPLTTIPTVMTSLKTWKAIYPDSPVWLRPVEWRDVFYLKLLARAEVIDPRSPVMIYPLQHPQDERLPMKCQVLGVLSGDKARAYAIDIVAERGVINDVLDRTKLAIFCHDDFMQVFDRQIDDGTALVFTKSEHGQSFADKQSGSEWTAAGACTSGPYKGRQLTPVTHYNKIFWYVWSDYHPASDIFGAPDNAEVFGASAA